ncbi:hypothetical protein [Bradyrhizobium sp. DASA03007]|uniref:hypothetical protein n=1 Tax=unclassified Bradyrhizobium TaxID=2631580 RepID=UPI003F7270D0
MDLIDFHAFKATTHSAPRRSRNSCCRSSNRPFQSFAARTGCAGTRHYISILASTNCSVSAARFTAEEVKPSGRLADYPNVNGVDRADRRQRQRHPRDGESCEALKRNTRGYACNPISRRFW